MGNNAGNKVKETLLEMFFSNIPLNASTHGGMHNPDRKFSKSNPNPNPKFCAVYGFIQEFVNLHLCNVYEGTWSIIT